MIAWKIQPSKNVDLVLVRTVQNVIELERELLVRQEAEQLRELEEHQYALIVQRCGREGAPKVNLHRHVVGLAIHEQVTVYYVHFSKPLELLKACLTLAESEVVAYKEHHGLAHVCVFYQDDHQSVYYYS